MTNQEAINLLSIMADWDEESAALPLLSRKTRRTVERQREAKKLAIAALKKQEPKVPTEISWEYDYFKCPSCGKLITSTTGIDMHKYCLECGQALKFTEDTE